MTVEQNTEQEAKTHGRGGNNCAEACFNRRGRVPTVFARFTAVGFITLSVCSDRVSDECCWYLSSVVVMIFRLCDTYAHRTSQRKGGTVAQVRSNVRRGCKLNSPRSKAGYNVIPDIVAQIVSDT